MYKTRKHRAAREDPEAVVDAVVSAGYVFCAEAEERGDGGCGDGEPEGEEDEDDVFIAGEDGADAEEEEEGGE